MAKANLYVGVDVGGTTIDAGLIDTRSGKVVKRENAETKAAEGQEAVASRIVDIINKVKDGDAAGVGLGMPGFIDYEKKAIIDSPHLPGFKDFPVADKISKEVGMAVALENDANCFTWGEFKLGAAKGRKDVVGLTIGTGIGGGIIINGALYHGAYGSASEIGHMVISSGRRPGFSGRQGTFDVYASARGLIRTHEEFAKETKTPQEIQELAEGGDALALKSVKRTALYLALGFNNIVNILNPEIVVLGGGLAQFDLLIKTAVDKFRADVSLPSTQKTEIVKGKLGRDGGLIGAALFAFEQ